MLAHYTTIIGNQNANTQTHHSWIGQAESQALPSGGQPYFLLAKTNEAHVEISPKKKSSTSNKEEIPSQSVLAIPRDLALCAQIVFFLSIRAGFKKQDDSDLGMVLKIVALKVPFSQRC